jgi:hypothetical protein
MRYCNIQDKKHVHRDPKGRFSSIIIMVVVDVSHGVIESVKSIERTDEPARKNSNISTQFR